MIRTFPLGRILKATPGALAALERAEPVRSYSSCDAAMRRGIRGELDREDSRENEYSLAHGFRLLSSYTTAAGEKLWIITEADRFSKPPCCCRRSTDRVRTFPPDSIQLVDCRSTSSLKDRMFKLKEKTKHVRNQYLNRIQRPNDWPRRTSVSWCPHHQQQKLTAQCRITKLCRPFIENSRISSHWRGPRRVCGILAGWQ